MAVATVREPVPVFIFFQYGKSYPLSISYRTRFYFFPYGNPYQYFISSSTGNHIRSQPLPVPVFHEKRIREDTENEYGFPY